MASITRFYALVLSTILLLSGVPGIFPNVVSFQTIVTFFALTLVHAVLHIVVGILGLLITALASDEAVRIYTIGIALLYGVLAAFGLAGVSYGSVLYFNAADNWLHGTIFVLSLGVFVAGLTESRLHGRKENIIATLPDTHWAIPSAPVQPSPSAVMGPPPMAAQRTVDSLQSPWNNPLPSVPQLQSVWGQDQRTNYQPQPQPQLQQYQPPLSQPGSQRDPWTREQRRIPYQQTSNSAGRTPAQDQPGNPWPQFPAPSRSQPRVQAPQWSSPGSSPSSPWSPRPQRQDSQPQDTQPGSRSGEQRLLNDWPSLRDS